MKMKRLSLPGAILGLGLLIGFSGPALASLFTTFTQSSCTGGGGFYSEMNAGNSGLTALATGPYGAICVYDVSGAVTVDAETFGSFAMVDGGALALNFAGTGGTAGGFTLATLGGIAWTPGTGPCVSGGAGNEDGFGPMNFKVNCQGSAADLMTQIVVTGTDTILLAADVLAFNTQGWDAGMHIFVPNCGSTSNPSCTGFAAEGAGTITETPEPQSLALLGIGMIGLGLVRRRWKS